MKHYDELFVATGKTIAVKTKLANLVGLSEAIVLSQIEYWLEVYRRDPDKFQDKHFHDGRWWVFNSYNAWHRQFPFWNLSTVKRTFKKLKDSGIVLACKSYNEEFYDHTCWYTIDYAVLDSILEESENTGAEITPPV